MIKKKSTRKASKKKPVKASSCRLKQKDINEILLTNRKSIPIIHSIDSRLMSVESNIRICASQTGSRFDELQRFNEITARSVQRVETQCIRLLERLEPKPSVFLRIANKLMFWRR